MAIARRQKNIEQGTSTMITIPAQLVKGQTSTVAADRLMLADPRGEIPEHDLLEFLENYIEPQFWQWIRDKQGKIRRRDKKVSKVVQKAKTD